MKLVNQLFKQIKIIQKKVNHISWKDLKRRYDKLTKLKKAGVIVCVLLVIWLFCGLFKATNEAKITAKFGVVKVVYLHSHAQEKEKYIKLSSFAESAKRVKILAPGNGKVFELAVKKGALVKRNQELAKIAPLDYASILAGAMNQVRELEEMIGESELISPVLAARLKEAQSELEKAKNYSKNMIIRAPIEGRIEKIAIGIGDEVVPKQELFLVVDPKNILYKAYVTEHLINKINTESPVKIISAAGTELSGKVIFVSKAANDKNLSYEIEVAYDNKEHEIVEGSSAELLILTDKVPAHQVDQSALVINDEGDLGVMVYNSHDNKAYFNKAEMIDQDSESIWITGLDKDADIIVMGQGFLKNGSDVAAKLRK